MPVILFSNPRRASATFFGRGGSATESAPRLSHPPRKRISFLLYIAGNIGRAGGGGGGWRRGKTQPDATWRTRHQLRPSKETMNNSLFAASVRGGAGRQQAACSFLLWSLLKESLSPCIREGGAPECRRCRPRRKRRRRTDEVVVERSDEEGEGQRGTTKEEDHVILLWYTSSSVPGSDVPLTRHTLRLASLQDPEEWVCLSYGSDRARC